MGAIDLSSAYTHLMVHESHWRFCGFQWGVDSEGRPRYFMYIALAFGSAQAPYVFQHIIWVVARFVRTQWGWRISCYMDDIALFCQVQTMAERRTARLALLLEELGFTLNRAKSVGIPGAEKEQRATQQLKLLGIWVDTEEHTFNIPRSRVEKARRAASTIQGRALRAHDSGHETVLVPVRELARFCGVIMSCYVAAGPVTRLMTRNIYAAIAKATGVPFDQHRRLLKLAWGGRAVLTAAALGEMVFWLDCLGRLARRGCPIRATPPLDAAEISSDASDHAIGCWLKLSQSSQIRIGVEALRFGEADESSTYRELVGIQRSLVMHQDDLRDRDIIVYVDNQGAASIMMQGSGVPELQLLAADIFRWAVARRNRVFAEWKPRESDEIVLCDWLSKLIDATAWGIDPLVFAALDGDPRFGGERGHDIDLFAAEGNTLLPRFFSRFHCRGAEAADAFKQDWLGRNGFANPPRTLIPRAIAHARMCECECTMLVPRDDRAAWWPMVAAPAQDASALPPGVVAVRDFDAYHGLFIADGKLPRKAPTHGVRAVRFDFRDWRWKNGGARPLQWFDELLGSSSSDTATCGLSSSAGRASAHTLAALEEALR